MKHQFLMGFLLMFCAINTMLAQESLSKEKMAEKPLLFAHLPSKFACNRPQVETMVHLSKSENVSIKLLDNLLLSGEVLENVQTAPGIQNINIRLSNFGNALLNISILTQSDSTKKIVGRIIHPKKGDALEISEENGRYYVTKHKLAFYMVE